MIKTHIDLTRHSVTNLPCRVRGPSQQGLVGRVSSRDGACGVVWFPSRALLASAIILLTLAVLTAPLRAAPLGLFEDHADVGSPRLTGSAAYDGVSQEYSMSAAGLNMWANRDEFHFLWKRMTG